MRDRQTGQPLALCVMGPTASGKTALAFALCEHFDCEIISVDSAQIYRGMDIGTAKPDPRVLQHYPHRLIDIRDPAEAYSAADFRRDALTAIAEISEAGKTPLLVGGTMLYFRVLRDGLSDLPEANPRIRQQILELATRAGWQAVHRQLAEVDPGSAARIHPNDPQRLQRALEVFLATGRSMSELHALSAEVAPLPCRLLQIAVAPEDRAVLHQRIAARFEAMLDAGLLDEVRRLYVRGDLSPSLPSIRSVGYRQAWDYLEGRLSYEAMKERAIIATRQLAKRQLTWLRSWPDLHWMLSDQWGSGDAAASEDTLQRALKFVRDATI